MANELDLYKSFIDGQDGLQFPYDAFDSMNYDFISRCEGEEWPE